MALKIVMRPEKPADIPAIQTLHLAAFDGPGEAQVVELLRSAGKAVVSIVAVYQGQVVGHILFSPVDFTPSRPGIRTLGLAPLAVLPAYQNQAVGSQLVQAGLAACRQLGVDAVVVLGHPEYYPRFGFRRAAEFGLSNEYGAGAAFMALEFSPGALADVDATARYASEFGQVGV
jgi:putative acetyltransferase